MIKSLKVGDYVLATKYHGGDPGDQWVVGFFTGMLPKTDRDRYEVADSEGILFRRNGFRRVKKISARRGEFLLNHETDINNCGRSVWWWARRKM